MQISKKTAKRIFAKLQPLLPYEVMILDENGTIAAAGSDDAEPERIAAPPECRRTLSVSGESVGSLVIRGGKNSREFSLLLDLAKEVAEAILTEDYAQSEQTARKNFRLALRNLLSYHDQIDPKTVCELLDRNNFDCDVPKTIVYFDLVIKERDQRITAMRDDTGSITTAGLVYDSFIEYLKSIFSRAHDVVLPCEDRHSVYVFCEDRSQNTELSDIQIYNICLQTLRQAKQYFWGDFHAVIGKRCVCFADYSGLYEQMKRRMESALLLFPGEHILFGRTTILGNVVAFISSHAKTSIIQLVLGVLLKDRAAPVYIETLRELFLNNMNMSLSAKNLHIHRNTLQYRIKRIEELTGYSIYDIDGALTLRLALLCHSYLEQFPEEGVGRAGASRRNVL